MERTKCKIKRLVPGLPVPTMSVSFDFGHLKTGTQDIDCHILEGGHPKTSRALVSRKDQLYSGTPPAPSETYCNTLLLVVDRSGEGTLVPTVACRLANCTGQVTPKEQKLDYSADMDATMFGSKKYQRMMNTSKRLSDTKAVSSSALEKSIMDIQDTDLNATNVSAFGGARANNDALVTAMLPPCNRDTKDVTNVYPVSSLLSPSDLADLEEIASLFLNPPDDPSKDANFIVFPFYKDMKNKTLLKVQLLLYANSILLLTRHNRMIRKPNEAIGAISPYSYSLGKKILAKFTAPSGNSRTMSSELVDKALCHAMVAILLASDFKLQADWFCGCLKNILKKHVMDLIRIVGLQKLSKLASHYYILKLPLPPIRTGRIQRRKK